MSFIELIFDQAETAQEFLHQLLQYLYYARFKKTEMIFN